MVPGGGFQLDGSFITVARCRIGSLYHFQIRFSTVLMELLQLEIEFSSLGNKDNGICPINIAHLAKKPGELGDIPSGITS